MSDFPYYPQFSTLTKGNLPASILMSRLYWWFTHTPTKLRVMREGKVWLAKSLTDMAEECGMSRQNARTADALLVKLGLVERKVWKFNRTPINHYHLAAEHLRHYHVATNTGGRVATRKSITIGIKDSQVTIKTQLLSDAVASRKTKGEHMAERTAREVLEGIQKKIESSPSKPQKVSAKSLSMFWMNLVPRHFDVGFQKPHTMRELGMLSQYIKITGKHALPAMEWAIRNWAKLRYRAKEELGEEVASTPTVPSLLKACVTAVEGYQKVGVKVHSPQPVQMNAHKVEGDERDKPATDAEVEAMLKSLKP